MGEYLVHLTINNECTSHLQSQLAALSLIFLYTGEDKFMHTHSENQKHNLYNPKNERSFYSTLLLSFLIISIISAVLLTAGLAAFFSHTLISSVRDYNRQLLSQTNYAVNKVDDDLNRLRTSLLGNDYITAFLSMKNSESTVPVLASTALNQQLITMPYVENIYLYNANLDIVYSSASGYQLSPSDYNGDEIIDRLKDEDFISSYDGSPVPGNRDSNTDAANIISYYIFENRNHAQNGTSAIVINVNTSVLTDSISTIKNMSFETDSSFLLLDSGHSYLTGVVNSSIEDKTQWVESALIKISEPGTSSFVSISGKNYLRTSTTENIYGWYLVNFTPVSVIFQDFVPLTLLSLLIMTIVLFISWLICRRFARQLNQPLEALTVLIKEKHPKSGQPSSFRTKEFQMIMDTVSSLHNSNEQLRSLQNQTKYSLIQSTLNELVSDRRTAPLEQIREKLNYLGLSWLVSEKLRMAVFKIDNYKTLLSQYSSDEMWTIRFSFVNISEELGSAALMCSAFSRDDDKFVLLTACKPDTDQVAFEDEFVRLLHSIQDNVEKYLHFSVTAAYSVVFQGIDRLPAIYKNTENSLRLKIRCGHGAVIDAHQIDTVRPEAFHLSYKLSSQLTDQLGNAQADDAWNTYIKLTEGLFECDYNEIQSVMIHLSHSIYERLSEKYPMLKDDFMYGMKQFLTDLDDAEIKEDIHSLSRAFFEGICTRIQTLKTNPAQQNSAIVTKQIQEIIEEQYADPSLCLASIAEEVGLSANYTGHIFKQQTQKSVAQYLLNVRMEKIAWYLQNTQLSVSTILEKTGLEKNNYFYTRFKNYFGMPLGEYRQKFQNSDKKNE